MYTFKIFVGIYAGTKESSGIFSLLEKVWDSSRHASRTMLVTNFRCWRRDITGLFTKTVKTLVSSSDKVLSQTIELQNFTCIKMTPTFWPHPWFITTNPVYFSFCRILVFDYFGLYFIHFNDRYFRLNSRSERRESK